MYRWIPISLIFANFWGVFVLNYIFHTEWYLIPINDYTNEVFSELFIISLILLFIGIFCFKLERRTVNVDYKISNTLIFKLIFCFFLIFYLSRINFSLDNTLRGVGQFDLENRAGFIDSLGLFSIPFILFSLYYKIFGNKTNKLIAFLCFIMILAGITNGGRRTVSYLFISLSIFFYYFSDIKIKSILKYGIAATALLSFAMFARDINNSVENSRFEFMFSLLQANSDPSILWAVKAYEARGFGLSPLIFMGHFWSIFIPSFIYSHFTGQLSYLRGSLYFDKLFNTNPNMGYDFMVLADYYWCFGYFGYFLFICMILFVFRYFKKHIYCKDGYKAIAGIIMIMYLCQQRNDFGAVLKPIVYSYFFLWILNKISKPRIIDNPHTVTSICLQEKISDR